MVKWTLEPGHTAAEFYIRHMMVTWVRGSFKNVKGSLNFDIEDPTNSSVEISIDAKEIWTGEPNRDKHLRGEGFLDVEKYPQITFKSDKVKQIGENDYEVIGDLTIRGVTKKAILNVRYLGQWDTPWWEGGENKGSKKRAGFVAETKINRHDFGVSWNDKLDKGGVVVGDDVFIIIDAEAVLD